MKRPALGKGLGALLGTIDPAAGERVANIELDLIGPNQYQPRRTFDEDKLKELASSISAGGIIQPLVVRRAGTKYELISGERRLQAARLAGLTMVPVIMRDLDEREMLVMALVENLQREDLNAVDESAALQRLVEDFGLSHQEVGRVIGKSRVHITNMLRVHRLPESIHEFLADGRLTCGHAKALAGIKDEAAMLALARRAAAEGLSVRQVEQLAAGADEAKVSRGTSRPNLSPHLRKVQQDLATVLGVPVRIHKGKRKGKIEIEFANADQLDSLLARMLG